MFKVKTKDVKPIVKATFPDYKRRECIVEVKESVTLNDLNWSGGSKSVYKACTVEGKEIPEKYDFGGPAPWNNPFEGKTFNIPENVCIVEGGWSFGKQKILWIYVNPANMPKLLPF